jgi:hypothetical protein
MYSRAAGVAMRAQFHASASLTPLDMRLYGHYNKQFWRDWSRDRDTRDGNIIKVYREEGSDIKERLLQEDILH